MPIIKIKNFGPIKEGYIENGGWIDIKKVTVFIGNQGSGKSTVAKAISTMSWVEKAIVRGDFEMPQRIFDIAQHFNFQNVANYFRTTSVAGDKTVIDYQGDAYNVAYRTDRPGEFLTTKSLLGGYKLPKIMYVPAERNFLSVVKDAFEIKGLPDTLFTFAEEYRRAQQALPDSPVRLPINNYEYYYDKQRDASYIIGDGYQLNLGEASSGIQSLVPLYLVSKNLAELLNKTEGLNSKNMSVTQALRMSEEIGNIMISRGIPDDEKLALVHEITGRFESKAFLNIVEEPEQNLFPSSQGELLNTLLELNNLNSENKLILTTHSPYIISYLTLAVQAGYLRNKIKSASSQPEALLARLNRIVPLKAAVKPSDVAIYQLDEKTGTISKLPSPEGIPSDKNYLNQSIAEGNHLFDAMLEIEEEI